MTNLNNMHGSEVRDGATYCTDCGVRLMVGGIESMKHTDPITHGRGACPNALTVTEGLNDRFYVVVGAMGVDAGQGIYGPATRAQAEAFRVGVIYGRSH